MKRNMQKFGQTYALWNFSPPMFVFQKKQHLKRNGAVKIRSLLHDTVDLVGFQAIYSRQYIVFPLGECPVSLLKRKLAWIFISALVSIIFYFSSSETAK